MNFFKPKEEKKQGSQPLSQDEQKYIDQITLDQNHAEGGYRVEAEENWSDEYLCYVGKQWDMSIAPRSNKDKTLRPNVVLNVALPTVMNIIDNLTTSIPQADINFTEKSDKEKSIEFTDVCNHVLYVNMFEMHWKYIVQQAEIHGPFIAYVGWDPDIIGGAGPDRFIGDIEVLYQPKNEIYFDPAISDLEKDMQQCRFIHRKIRKTIEWITENFDNGKYVEEDYKESYGEDSADEGPFPHKATIIERWHVGLPKFMPKKDIDRLNGLAAEAEEAGLPYKAKEYRDMAQGKVKGVHRSYTTSTVFLEYTPYVFDDGKYPFAFAVLYIDEANPLGMGDMRNIMNPQVMYNKCAEIEMEAADVEGLGGYFMEEGAMSPSQLDSFITNARKGGAVHKTQRNSGIQQKEGSHTPQSLIQLKEFFKTNIDTISQNTAIMQGESPGANVPFASVQSLGSRADVRNKGKMETMKRFFKQILKLMISRILQFYTEDRKYRIRNDKSVAIKEMVYKALDQLIKIPDPRQQLTGVLQLLETLKSAEQDDMMEYGTFNAGSIKKKWQRGDTESEMEEYIPDFDARVKMTDERPSSRTYYEQIAMAMYGRAMGPKAFWQTVEDGKLPSIDEILSELDEMQQAQMQAQNPTPQPGMPHPETVKTNGQGSPPKISK